MARPSSTTSAGRADRPAPGPSGSGERVLRRLRPSRFLRIWSLCFMTAPVAMLVAGLVLDPSRPAAEWALPMGGLTLVFVSIGATVASKQRTVTVVLDEAGRTVQARYGRNPFGRRRPAVVVPFSAAAAVWHGIGPRRATLTPGAPPDARYRSNGFGSGPFWQGVHIPNPGEDDHPEERVMMVELVLRADWAPPIVRNPWTSQDAPLAIGPVVLAVPTGRDAEAQAQDFAAHLATLVGVDHVSALLPRPEDDDAAFLEPTAPEPPALAASLAAQLGSTPATLPSAAPAESANDADPANPRDTASDSVPAGDAASTADAAAPSPRFGRPESLTWLRVEPFPSTRAAWAGLVSTVPGLVAVWLAVNDVSLVGVGLVATVAVVLAVRGLRRLARFRTMRVGLDARSRSVVVQYGRSALGRARATESVPFDRICRIAVRPAHEDVVFGSLDAIDLIALEASVRGTEIADLGLAPREDEANRSDPALPPPTDAWVVALEVAGPPSRGPRARPVASQDAAPTSDRTVFVEGEGSAAGAAAVAFRIAAAMHRPARIVELEARPVTEGRRRPFPA